MCRISEIKKSLSTLFIMALAVFQLSYAQNEDTNLGPALTEAQEQLIKKEREILRKNRETLKKTLTAEQKSVLYNSALSRQERLRQLNSSFSDEQKALINSQELSLNRIRASFNRSMTEEQRQLQKERLLRRFRNFRDRAELRDRERPSTIGN